MTVYVLADQGFVSLDYGEAAFIKFGVVVQGGIFPQRDASIFNNGNVYGSVACGAVDGGGVRLTVSASGSIQYPDHYPVSLSGGANRVINDGQIAGSGAFAAIRFVTTTGSYLWAANTVVNTGTISSADAQAILSEGESSTVVTNEGLIHGEVLLNGRGNFVTNHLGGTIEAYALPAIEIANGSDNHVSNAGTITTSGPTAAIIFRSVTGLQTEDVNSLVNTGTISCNTTTAAPAVVVYHQGDAILDITNTGTLYQSNGYAIYNAGIGDTTIISTGLVHGGVFLTGGINNLIDLRGGVMQGKIESYATGTSTVYGTELENTITTGTGNDYIDGAGGADRIAGGAGNDTLIGGEGNDILNGGADRDLMQGGNGDDIYYVNIKGDVADETGGSGIDRIISTIGFSLVSTAFVKGAVENLTLSGGAAISGTGNTLANTIIGNAAANSLNGALGNDTLTGGNGADSFVFSTVLNSATNFDTITDFVHGTDKIVLENAIFAKLTATGVLAAANFAQNAAADANDYIIYNTTTGVLSYDADGNGAGAAIAIATLTNLPGMASTDFTII